MIETTSKGKRQVVTLSEAGGAWRQFYRENGRSDRAFELFAAFRQSIERGRQPEPIPVRADVIGAQAIDRHQNNRQRRTQVMPPIDREQPR